MVGAAFIPFFFLNFTLEFLGKDFLKRYKFLSYFNFSLAVFFSLLIFSNLIIHHLEPVLGFLFWPKGGNLFYFFLLYFFFNVVLAHILLFKSYKKTKNFGYLFTFLATTLAFIGGSTNYFLWINIPIPPIGNLLVTVYALLMAYAITKHGIMDMSVVVTKTVANIFTAIFMLISIFITYSITKDHNIINLLSTSTLLLFWGFYGNPFRLFLQTTLEKKFLKNRYNYASVIQRFVDGFGKCSEIDDVAQVLKSTFNDEMEIADVRVYFPEFYEMTFRTSGTFVELVNDTDQTTHAPLTTDTNWIQTLSDQKTVLISSELTELADLGIAAALPCFEDGNLVCLVLLGKKLSEDGFKPEDVSLFSTIASQIPAVLDRIHRSRASVELDLAQRIQTEILPKAPEIPGLELACYMKPADEVGGDYYDVVVAGEFAWVLLGDVTGHGLGSGLVMFMAQSILTSILQTREQIEPAELNYLANQILYKNLQRLDEQLPMTFVSLCFHEGRSFTVSGCHDNFLIYRAASQSIEMLSLDHFALGIGFSDSFVREDYTQSAYTLAAGDVIFMVTDGITEAFCGGNVKLEQYGEERLKGLFLKHAARSAEEVKAALIAELDEFTGGIYHDDVTFIVAKAV